MYELPDGLIDVSLAPMTTLGVGGPARRMIDVTSVEALVVGLDWARQKGWPTLILGDGSNLFVGDAGFDGLVIRLAARRLVFRPEGRILHIWADAGASWDRLVDEAVARNAQGIECLTGIPGRVGAAPIQNIGAYGQELADTAVAVEAVERSSGRSVRFSTKECGFGYRTSRFKRERDRWVVTRVQLALRVAAQPELRYADLVRRAQASGQPMTLATVRELVREIRAEKSMLRIPGDENFHSAGSFFTNPVVSPDQADRAEAVAGSRTSAKMPRYPAEGGVKLSAAWLIEQSGFQRGWGDGPAGLSTKHTLAIVNRGRARSTDVLRVAVAVRDGVLSTFGIELIPEPVMVGFDWPGSVDRT